MQPRTLAGNYKEDYLRGAVSPALTASINSGGRGMPPIGSVGIRIIQILLKTLM
jgi:hypothetical protein